VKTRFTKAWSGAVAIAIAAATAPLFSTPAAFAAGTLVGPATVKNAGGAANLNSGNSGTAFTLRLPAGASCPGDSANDGYRWQTYMVPASVDPGSLQFGANGPNPGGIGAAFRQPLFDTTGSPIVQQQTQNAATPPGPGPIINIPDANYAVFSPGDIPAGAYNVGVACTLGPPSATQLSSYWNVTKTFTTNASGGPAQVNWSVGAAPGAPTGVVVTPGDTSVSVAFNPGPATPAASGYTATATPTTGAPVTGTGAGSPITISGLTNGTSYSVTVHATNTVGNSAESAATPVAPPASFGPLNQTVTVNVPAGTLVFTQICGKHNALPTDTFAPGAPASTPSQESGPTTTAGGSTVDPNYPVSYPAPASPTYPTWCGLSLGTSSLVNGQPYSAATGILNQVTVTDTRQTDAGWKVTGQMAPLTGTPAGTIQGNQLGWRPQATPQGSYAGYTQTVGVDNADPGVAPSAANHGLGTSQRLGYAAPGAGLGPAQLDARVKLLIPLNTPAGSYSGVLTLSLYPS